MSIDIWNILSLVGTVAFASSGAIVAIEEEFDILGLFILGFVTAFGGGAIRNVLIGLLLKHFGVKELLFMQQQQLFYLL